MFIRALFAFLALPGVVAFAVPIYWLLATSRTQVVQPLGLLPLVAGCLALLWCVRDFYVYGKGTLAPWSPPAHLVVSGLYRYTRNPMYLAVLLILFGWAISFRVAGLYIYAIVVGIAFHLRVLLGEEPWLARRHGAQWLEYAGTVPRWLWPLRKDRSMTELKSPGVYVEETSLRARSIEGVSTSTAAFVGPTLVAAQPRDSTLPAQPLTTFAEFAQSFGGLADIETSRGARCNYIAHSVRAFFENGGSRLYIARVAPDASAAEYAAAMQALQLVTDISVIAAPGYSARPDAVEIQQALLDHVNQPGRYRFAVLDAPPAAATDEVLAVRNGIDTSFAAIYHPWVTVNNPVAVSDDPQTPQLQLPPSGLVCGIFARIDATRGVWKAPANEPLVGALGLEVHIDDREQELLNAQGVNCIRPLADRGILLWGARTTSSDPEWKYVNVRRYLMYLEQSIDEGLQWVVFEPNDERLWSDAQRTVSDFLLDNWRRGALMGSKAEHALFVRCDRSTMTQGDLDDGRLVIVVGVAPLMPSEFVIFRIGQWTADRCPTC
jgi:phage tail sheath protein FI/protein-S-isoprenylcysteine O-methyltransferase Ste14